jgi:hypothetical protein
MKAIETNRLSLGDFALEDVSNLFDDLHDHRQRLLGDEKTRESIPSVKAAPFGRWALSYVAGLCPLPSMSCLLGDL